MEAKTSQSQTQTIPFVLVGLAVFFICAGVLLFLVWSKQYEGHIGPRVFVGSIDVSGLTPEAARRQLQSRIDAIITQGVLLKLDAEEKTLVLTTLIGSDSVDDIAFDVATAVEQALKARHAENDFLDRWLLLSHLWKPVFISLPVSISEKKIKQNIVSLFSNAQQPAQDARFVFSYTGGGWHVTVTPDQSGNEILWSDFFHVLKDKLSMLDVSMLTLSTETQDARLIQADAQVLTADARAALQKAPLTITFENEHQQLLTWTLSQWALSNMIMPTNQGIGLDEQSFQTWLDPIARTIEKPAQNARFQIVDGRVVDFADSQPGLRVDRQKLLTDIRNSLGQNVEIATVVINMQTEEPIIKTGDVNNLGVTEILGIGTSSYKGSPKNRRANIQNGVRLLNGRLIAPDETVSLIEWLKPFDAENGYLPELVIKGNKITPELGGGLCQIGTTTFRATMNTGLPIIERSNHSLVVSYYNDSTNKNPGTDATIYEPSPDFKFKNDTGHYLLFQAENLTDTQELRFTFWGTSDGRKSSYEPPTVIRWIPTGPEQRTETTDLKPGEEKCQEAHVGADALFVYKVSRADGTVEERTFTSHYRPLPKICLVGVEKPVNEPTQTQPLHDSTTP